MVFSSISFLYYFLPIVLIIYFIVPKKFRNLVLLIFSLLFYFYGEPIYILLMLSTIFISYIFGILIDKFKDTKYSKLFMIIGITLCLSSLIIFKYFNFFTYNFNLVFNTKISLLKLVMPIGISFYTFQIISYLIDVYKKEISVQKNFINLAMYVSLFPQLIAGPIVRYKDINKEINDRETTIDDFSYGIKRFIIGLSKKVIIANSLGLFIETFNNISEKSVLFYILYALSLTLQIYFDFSGYSDMAIGMGRMFGFKFLENFNYPYIAKSITDFWRRWHISLSSWFKDYIYIPLGGNRTSKIKWLRNILIVWLLTGLWHGANWNFIIWGLFFAMFLLLEKLFLKKYLDKIPNIFGNIYTMFLVIISFVIFSIEDLSILFATLKSIFGFNNLTFTNSITNYYLSSYLILFIISIIGATPLLRNVIEKLRKNKILNNIINILEIIVLVLLLLLVTAYLVDGSFNPFIYFRF